MILMLNTVCSSTLGSLLEQQEHFIVKEVYSFTTCLKLYKIITRVWSFDESSSLWFNFDL